MRQITVDGKEIPRSEHHRYVIRFHVAQVEGRGEIMPTLYRDGKRVTSRVTLDFHWEIPADEAGANANTA